MKNQTPNQSMYTFLRSELRLLLILISSIAIWSLVSTYLGYRTPDLFSWEYILGFMIVYPFISFINRRYLKV